MKKRILGWIVTISILTMMFPYVVVNAMTAQEGANWALARVGQSIDTDGYYGAQCKDFVNAYCQQNWGFTPPGNAKDLIYYNYPSGWQKIQNTPDFLPQPGDIAVWTYGSFATYGHCGIITSANLSTFTSVDQNWYGANGTTGSPAAVVDHNYNGFWGVIRPPFNNIDPIKPIHQDTNTHVRNGFFTFRNVASNKMMQVNGGVDANGRAVDMWDYDGSIDQRFNVQHKGNGKYKLYAECSSTGTNRVVDVFRNNAALAAGQKVDLWDPNDDIAQLFYIWPVGSDQYVFELANLDGYVICPSDASAAGQNGAQLVVQKYTGASYQKWKLCNNNGKQTAASVSYANGSYKVDTDTDELNMRASAVNGTILLSIPSGTVLSVTQVSNNWGYTNYRGTNGWVCLDFTVYTVVLDSISVSKNPIKTTYFAGDKFSADGMEITARFSNGQTEKLASGFTATCDLSTPGTKNATVTYKEKTTTFPVTVQEKSIKEIAPYELNTKKEYNTGDIIGNDDLSILVTYNNNGTEIVNSGYNTSYDFSTPGTKTVTVSYGGKTTSYDVEVMSSGSDTTEKASFSISAKSGYSGSTVTVPVKLNASNVYDGNMTIQYDASKLSIENVQAVGALSDRQVTINKEYAANKIRVSFSGTTPINSNETILNLEFKALDNAQGTATISIAEAKAYNKSGGAIVTDTSDGSVQITAVADNVTVTNIQSVSQNGRKVVTANVSDERVMCFLAAYQGGVLVECDSAHPSNGTFEVSVEESPNTQYKLMVWNMAMKPMMNSVNIY